MKRYLFLILLVLLFIAAACGPEKPQDVLAYCKAGYEEILADDPNFPPAFIGACTSFFQTGRYDAFSALCRYEPFWAEFPVVITSPQECMQYLRGLE